jgi:hypothetical protein
MGIKKRRLIFPRSSVTNREHGTGPNVRDLNSATPLRRFFSSELRIGRACAKACPWHKDRALFQQFRAHLGTTKAFVRQIGFHFCWSRSETEYSSVVLVQTSFDRSLAEDEENPGVSLQSRPARTIFSQADSATFRYLIAFFS